MAEIDGSADAWRDALAILAGALQDDYDGVGTVVLNCNLHLVIASLAAMLFESLRDRGVDPAEWVAAEQARSRGDLG